VSVALHLNRRISNVRSDVAIPLDQSPVELAPPVARAIMNTVAAEELGLPTSIHASPLLLVPREPRRRYDNRAGFWTDDLRTWTDHGRR
jgi:hypothetical protein